MPMRTLLLLALCLLLAIPAHALVVGRGGAVYPIKERDFLEIIAERIAGIDPRALQEKLQNVIQDEARTFRPHDAVGGLPPADKDELYRVDLSFTVTPELAKAVTDINGASIYPEGLRVNPLKIMAEKGIGYPFILVVLNADRPAELRWFKDTGYNDDPRVKLLITDGYPYDLALELGRPVYQLSRGLRDRFQIRATPSLVFWPVGTDTLAVRTVHVTDSREESAPSQTVSASQEEINGR